MSHDARKSARSSPFAREIENYAKPQAVPKCEHGWKREHFILLGGNTVSYLRAGQSGIYCPGPQPTQAVGDEVEASQTPEPQTVTQRA